MAKFNSRLITYTVVAGVALYAVVLLTEPEAPAKKASTRSSRSGPTAPAGFTPEDLTARFDRYSAPKRNAFAPGIISQKRSTSTLIAGFGSGMLPALGGRGAWALTGVSSINGVRSALVENSASGDSAFLEEGENWNGMRVATVESNAVVLENPLGQRTRLTFVDPMQEARIGGAGAPTATVVPRPGGITVPPGGVAPVTPTFPQTATSGAVAPAQTGRQ